MSNFSFEPLKLKLATNNIIIPMENGVADLTNAETSAKIMLAGKELFPIFDESIGGRNLIKDKNYARITKYETITREDNSIGGHPYMWKSVRKEGSTDSTPNTILGDIGLSNPIPVVPGEKITFSLSCGIENGESLPAGRGLNINLRCGGISRPILTTRNNPLEKIVAEYIIPDGVFDISAIWLYTPAQEFAISYFTNLFMCRGIQTNPEWTPAPEDVLQLSTLSSYNCSAAIVDDLVKITSHTPDTKRGWVDVTVNYGNLSNTKRLNWSVEGVEPYKPSGTLLTMNNRGIKY